MQGDNSWTANTTQANIMERFQAVLYPIDIGVLWDRLPELGWLVRRRMTQEGVISLRDAPSKGNTQLLLDQGNKTVGVAGNDLAEAIASFRELNGLLRELFDFPAEVSTDYVEFRYIGWIKNGSDPTEILASWWGDHNRSSHLGNKLARLLPSDAAALLPYGVRFAPNALDANRRNWVEVNITPQSIAGSHRYHFDLLFRNQDIETTMQVAESADEILNIALTTLEHPDG